MLKTLKKLTKEILWRLLLFNTNFCLTNMDHYVLGFPKEGHFNEQ